MPNNGTNTHCCHYYNSRTMKFYKFSNIVNEKKTSKKKKNIKFEVYFARTQMTWNFDAFRLASFFTFILSSSSFFFKILNLTGNSKTNQIKNKMLNITR